MSDGLQIIGVIIVLFFLGLVMTNPTYFGLPGYSNHGGITSNTTQLVVNERVPKQYAERSNFPNSATNDDENGEIVIAGKTKGVNVTASVGQAFAVSSGSTVNYGALLLVILMLVVIVVLARITMRKRGRVEYQRSRMNPNYQYVRLPNGYYQPQPVGYQRY